MIKRILNHTVVFCYLGSVAFVLVYAVLCTKRKPLGPAWESTPVSVRTLDGKTSLALFPFFRRRSIEASFLGTERLSEIGYIGRYLLGEMPSFIFKAQGGSLDVLHYRSELPLLYPSSRGAIKEELSSRMRALNTYCRAKGATLIVVPVPLKVSIGVPPAPASQLWLDDPFTSEMPIPSLVYSEILKATQGSAIDLFEVFRASQQQNTFDLFLPYDNHWTSFAIALTAREITKRIHPTHSSLIVFDSLRPLLHDTFFMDALRLPEFFTHSAHQFRWREPLFTVLPAVSKASTGRIFLAGTSFSDRLRKTAFGLGSLLRKSTGRQVLDASISGQGKFASLREIFRRGFDLAPGDILVWEFPASQANARDGELSLPPAENLL